MEKSIIVTIIISASVSLIVSKITAYQYLKMIDGYVNKAMTMFRDLVEAIVEKLN